MNKIYIGNIAHLKGDPNQDPGSLEIMMDGGLVVGPDGKILDIGHRSHIKKAWPDAVVNDFSRSWILPGFVDGHIHFPQYYATVSRGDQLLDWLNNSIFPNEIRYRDPEVAETAASRFVRKLVSSGTTTALVFGSQFHQATQALFYEARVRGLRMIAGHTLMDRFGPEELFTPAQASYDQAVSLIKEVADHPLLDYAITPRFAISCSHELMEVCRQLKKEHPRCYVQTHINENLDEIEKVKELFPKSAHYADVYDQYQLLTPETVLAHNIHAGDEELTLLKERNCAVCHCPASNSYLGSGLFPLKKHWDYGLRVMMGTDVGAGTHFSILRELGDAYKVQQLQRFRLNAAQLLYLGTLAGAKALNLDHRIGNFQKGKECDLVVVDPSRESYLLDRLNQATSLEEQLFAILNLAGPQHLAGVMVAGRVVFEPMDAVD